MIQIDVQHYFYCDLPSKNNNNNNNKTVKKIDKIRSSTITPAYNYVCLHVFYVFFKTIFNNLFFLKKNIHAFECIILLLF